MKNLQHAKIFCAISLFIQFITVLLVIAEDVTIEQLYVNGVKAYNEESWLESIRLMENALVRYKMLQDVDATCNLKCKRVNATKELGLNFDGLNELHTYSNLIVQTNCIKICKEEHPYRTQNLQKPKAGFADDFTKREPYNYLQYAYYRTGQIKKACQAAFTYLQRNPEDEQMKENIVFYQDLPDIEDSDFKDLEARPYFDLFVDGAAAYEAQDYDKTIEKIESFFIEYYKSYDECMANCYSDKPPTYLHGIHLSTSARYHEALECMLKCVEDLAPVVNGHVIGKVVPRCYSYLQFAYYKKGNFSGCVPAAASHLLLDSESDNAITNMQYYKQIAKEKRLTPRHFKTRSEALEYSKLQRTLWQLVEKTNNLVDFDDEDFVPGEEEDSIRKLFQSTDLLSSITNQISTTLNEKLRGELG